MGLFNNLFGKKKNEKLPPAPKWKPDVPIDLDLTLKKARYYTGDKLQLAIFKNGTVVFFANRVENIEPNAKLLLEKIYHFHPDFKPLEMDDGNYLIEYSQPAFTIVFKSEIERFHNYIEANYTDGICENEVLLNGEGEANVFDQLGKICLFGRAKMFMDAREPKIVKVFDPK